MSESTVPDLQTLRRWAALPLDVGVVIDTLSLSMRDIAALTAGDVLRTRRSSADPLTLVVGGVPVASVTPEAGERTCVRITGVHSTEEPLCP